MNYEEGFVMKTVAWFAFALCVSLVSTVSAEVFEFELPDLAGMTAGTNVTTAFVYDGPDGNVNSIMARVIGDVHYIGRVECFTEPPDTSDWPLDFGTALRKPGETGYWTGWPDFLDQVGPFDRTYGHNTYSGGFTTVSNGDTIQVDAHFLPAALVGICHPITPPPTGTVSRALILLDVSAPVPVEESTWGRIKALYE
jgi:hypothetical protein